MAYEEARALAPTGRFRGTSGGAQVQTLRVFAGGAVIQIGRWPGAMAYVYERFLCRMHELRPIVDATQNLGQRKLEECLGWSGEEQAR